MLFDVGEVACGVLYAALRAAELSSPTRIPILRLRPGESILRRLRKVLALGHKHSQHLTFIFVSIKFRPNLWCISHSHMLYKPNRYDIRADVYMCGRFVT